MEDNASAPRPIKPQSTETAAFVGLAESGPTEPTLVGGFSEFTEIFGASVDSSYLAHAARSFFEILVTVTPRQVIKVAFLRGGETRTTTLRAEELPDELVAQLTDEMLGLDLRGRREGGFLVMAVRSGSGADRIGIRVGDLILAVNGRGLTDHGALRRSILDLRGRSRALIVVQRGAGRYNVSVPLI